MKTDTSLPRRDLRLLADGREIAQGCRMNLTARETLSLRPALHEIEIRDLSESSRTLLSAARRVEVRSGNDVLVFGEPVELFSRPVSGARSTSLIFSPGLALWNRAVSLSLAGGLKISDTVRAILAAADADAPLIAFSGQDRVLTRPQAFFGRACDDLSLLGDAAGADVFLSFAGICFSARSGQSAAAALAIPEHRLLAAPVPVGTNRVILTADVFGCLPGTPVQTTWKDSTFTGRLVSRLILADNRTGSWRTELEIEVMNP